jgi:quercetin dioxygenase-like cupin family protein
MSNALFTIVLGSLIWLNACKSGTEQKIDIIFPKGEKVTNNNFTGNVWLEALVENDTIYKAHVGNVSFERGARTKWHYHPAGQILLVTSGTGYYQEKGSPKRVIRKGDVIKCAPNQQHWHGASKDDGMTHIGITFMKNGLAVWLEQVTDEEYNAN